MVVGPPGYEPDPLGCHCRGQRLGIGHHLGGVGAELGAGCLGERHRFAGDHVLQGAALQAREDGAVDGLGQLGGAQDGPATGAAQGLVGSERDDVGHADR